MELRYLWIFGRNWLIESDSRLWRKGHFIDILALSTEKMWTHLIWKKLSNTGAELEEGRHNLV